MPAVDDFKSFNRLDQVVSAPESSRSSCRSSTSSSSRSVASLAASALAVARVQRLARLGLPRHAAGPRGHRGRRRSGSSRPQSLPQMPVGVNLLTLVLSALGFICLVIARIHNSKSAGFGAFKVSVHLGIVGYLLVLVSLGAGRRRVPAVPEPRARCCPTSRRWANRTSAPDRPARRTAARRRRPPATYPTGHPGGRLHARRPAAGAQPRPAERCSSGTTTQARLGRTSAEGRACVAVSIGVLRSVRGRRLSAILVTVSLGVSRG